MAYRAYKRRWKRWKRRTDWRQVNARKREEVSARYGGIDHDVRQVFFNLPSSLLTAVFQAYRKQFGSSACGYARQTYEKWRTNQVEMSSQVSERLLAIVPRYLDFATKHDLIAKLWRRQGATSLRVTIASDTDTDAALDCVSRAVDSVSSGGIPESLAARLNWLAEDDAVAAQLLFKEVLAREYELGKGLLRSELEKLLSIYRIGSHSATVQASHVARFFGGTITIFVSDVPKQIRSKCMSNDANAPNQSGSLVLANGQQHGGQLAPIQDPNNLLAEALRLMPPQKQVEVMGKAADEALRLQVKVAENKIDQGILDEKLDQAVRVAQDVASNKRVQVDFTTEHKSDQGDTRIAVRTKPERPVVVQAPNRCFVATACFGDYDHPTVMELRRFRDLVLMESALGRRFISAYYRYGPVLAGWVNRLPVLKPPIRCALSAFVHVSAENHLARPRPPAPTVDAYSRGDQA